MVWLLFCCSPSVEPNVGSLSDDQELTRDEIVGSHAWRLYANPQPVKYRAMGRRFNRASRRARGTSERSLTACLEGWRLPEIACGKASMHFIF